MVEVIPEPVGDCRFCGGPTWQGDARGPAHRCCAHPVTHCVACSASLDPYLIERGARLHPGCTWPGYPCPSCHEAQRAAAHQLRRAQRADGLRTARQG